MKLFEATWKDEYNYFERFYNTDTKNQKKEKLQYLMNGMNHHQMVHIHLF